MTSKEPQIIDEAKLRLHYSSHQDVYERLKEESLYIMTESLAKAKIKTHEITGRVKSIDSLLDKVRRKRYANPFSDVDDIVGIRVVCLFLSDIPKIANVIRSVFDVKFEENKIEGMDVSSFGYMSVHFIVSIPERDSGVRYEGLHGINVEIQVRTLAMHAWASISHYLLYKTEEDVPSELKRDFFALSGLFYVADSHFEMFYRSRMEALSRIEKLESQNSQEINLDTLIAYFRRKFPDRKHCIDDSTSELVSVLNMAEYKSIGQIDTMIDKGMDAFLHYEGHRKDYWDVAVLRILLEIADRNFREADAKYLYRKYPERISSMLRHLNSEYAPYEKYVKK